MMSGQGQGQVWSADELDAAWEGMRAALEQRRREEQAQRRADVRQSEAYLERMVELRLGELQRLTPDIETWPMETGLGYRPTIVERLTAALGPYGPHALRAALGAIKTERIAFGTPGIPDRAVVVGGRAALLELKRAKGGVVSEVQRQWHEAARRRGCFVTVVTDAEQVGPALQRARAGAVE